MSRQTLHLGIVGPGLVGACLLRQIAQQLNHISRTERYNLRVVGIARSREMVLLSHTSTDGIDATSYDTAAASKSAVTVATDLSKFIDHIRGGSDGGYAGCLVDCTSSQLVADQYVAAMTLGVHVVTPNKKAFSGAQKLFNSIYSIQRQPSRVHCFHETTVGAGLPIIGTLQGLLAAGDEIVSIEGIFSGTLSYIFNEFSTPNKDAKPGLFSSIVATAKANGYTEPDPRDDLNGLDVARKVTILGRICGLDVSLETLPIDNVVPEPLRSCETAEDFMAKLPEFDKTFEEMNAKAANDGHVLRYVGVVSPGGKCAVKLGRYPFTHPFASLKGSDNIIAFKTKRYPNPLIVQGAGAGAEVTAQGAFGDIINLAKIAC